MKVIPKTVILDVQEGYQFGVVAVPLGNVSQQDPKAKRVTKSIATVRSMVIDEGD